jgi:hypothetical protein
MAGVEGERAFSELPIAVRVQIIVGGPLLAGMVTGFLLGETATGWWVAQGLAAVGGFLAGFDHATPREAALRGLAGGTLFGLGIVVADAISDNPHAAHAPSPIGTIVIFTALVSVLLALLGSRVGRA